MKAPPTDLNRPKPKDAQRLDAAAWTDAGLAVLAQGGVDAVRVEPLARVLGVTKGSFYWHFKDRADLLRAMLVRWRQQATLKIIERIERTHTAPMDKLRQLIDLPVLGKNSPRGASLELAIRLWAKSDAQAAEAIAEIDRHRLAHIAGLLRASGQEEDAQVEARAFLYYAFMLAEAFIASEPSPRAKQACDELLAGARTGEREPKSQPQARVP